MGIITFFLSAVSHAPVTCTAGPESNPIRKVQL